MSVLGLRDKVGTEGCRDMGSGSMVRGRGAFGVLGISPGPTLNIYLEAWCTYTVVMIPELLLQQENFDIIG